jgi:enediyne polyketide synthase
MVLLPVRIGRVVLSGPLPQQRLMCSALERSHQGETYIWDLTIRNEAGLPQETWEGLELRVFRREVTLPAWSPALLGSYLERIAADFGANVGVAVDHDPRRGRADRKHSVAALLAGTDVRVSSRLDGRPEIGRTQFSFSHLDALTVGVCGQSSIGCDLAAVDMHGSADWKRMLGDDLYGLAVMASRESGESLPTAATRVWTVLECLQKAGTGPNQPVVLEPSSAPGWLHFRSGSRRILSGLERVAGFDKPVAIGILIEDEKCAATTMCM